MLNVLSWPYIQIVMWVSQSPLWDPPGLKFPNISTEKLEPSGKVMDLFTSVPKHFQTVGRVWHLELNGANLSQLHPIAFMMWFETSLYFWDALLPTTHTSIVSLLSTTSSENWGSYELNQEGQPLWSSFFVATVACSGFLRNGQCSELQCLDEADNQLCGWRNKCFMGLGNKD